MKENKEDVYKYLCGAYYGVELVDEYSTKEYVMQDIDNYIKKFLEENEIDDYQNKRRNYEQELSDKTKLQDSLLVLPKVKAPLELILLIKLKLKEIREEEVRNTK